MNTTCRGYTYYVLAVTSEILVHDKNKISQRRRAQFVWLGCCRRRGMYTHSLLLLRLNAFSSINILLINNRGRFFIRRL